MYNPKTYKVKDDIEIVKIINKNELSTYTVSTYYSVIKQFSNCIMKPYHEIVNELRLLQRDKIIGDEIIRYNPNDSLTNNYIHQFMKYLKDKGNKKSSINLKTKQLMSLLKKSNIKIPNINFKIEPKQKKTQLITTEDIRYILNHSSTYHKALFTFIASTGIRRYDVVNNFKIEDFIEACNDYTDAINLNDFLDTAPKNMIPYFEFIPNKTKKTGLPCKVCCSAEASNLILESLKMRMKSVETHNKKHDDDLVLTEECPLFSSKLKNYVGKLNENSVTSIFHYKNVLLKDYKELELTNLLNNNEISNKEYRLKMENIPKFHPHSLRHRFITTIRQYITNRDICLLFEGHASSIKTDKHYIGENKELFSKNIIRKTYLQAMPYLTFNINIKSNNNIQSKLEINNLKRKTNYLNKEDNDLNILQKQII